MVIGGIFVVSGFEKLIGPYQNFLYIVQNYSFLPFLLAEFVARVLPWIEFFLGLFLLLGLWLKWTLRAVMVLVLMFMAVVMQALIRNLPIDECGCFGALLTVPLPVVLASDTTIFFLTWFLLSRRKEAERYSLDSYWAQNENA